MRKILAPNELKENSDLTLLITAFIGYIVSIAGISSLLGFLYSFGFSLIVLFIMITYSLSKKIELISTAVAIMSIGLSFTNNKDFLVFLMISIILVIISIVNKSVEKLVVADLFIATNVMAITYIISNGIYDFKNILFLFLLTVSLKYVYVVYLNTDKKADKINNTWTIVTGIIIILKIVY